MPALTPVFWNLAIIVGLVLGVPHAHTLDAKLYVYAVSIVDRDGDPGAAAAARGSAGSTAACSVVIDWRDPAVAGSSS